MELPLPVKAVDLTLATIAPLPAGPTWRPGCARPGPGCSTTEGPGAGRRGVQAGQEPAGQLAGQRAGLPGVRRRGDGGVDRRCATPSEPQLTLVRRSTGGDGPPAEQRRPSRPTSPLHELSEAVARLRRRAAQPGQPAGPQPRRGRHPAAHPAGRPGDRRHPGRRRAQLGARRGHHVRAALRGRGAAGLRRLPGVHRARAGVPAPGRAAVPERGLRADQDRPVPGVAPDRRARPRPPARRPASTPSCSRCRRRCAGRRCSAATTTLNAESGFPELEAYLARAGARPGRPAGPPLDGARRPRGDRPDLRRAARRGGRPAQPRAGRRS